MSDANSMHSFDAWWAERVDVESALDRTPERQERERNRLFERALELEKLILETRSSTPQAIRAKARMIRWRKEMEQAEELPAMREVEAFVERLVSGSAATVEGPTAIAAGSRKTA